MPPPFRSQAPTFRFNELAAEVQLLILELTLETDIPTVDPDFDGNALKNDLVPRVREDLFEHAAHKAHIINILRVNKMFRDEGIKIILRRHSVAYTNGSWMRGPPIQTALIHRSFDWDREFRQSCIRGRTTFSTDTLSYRNLKFIEIRFIWAEFDPSNNWMRPWPWLFKLMCASAIEPVIFGRFPNLERYTIEIIDAPKSWVAQLYTLRPLAAYFQASRRAITKLPELVIRGLPPPIERKMIEEFRAFVKDGGRIGVSKSQLKLVPGQFELRRVSASKGSCEQIKWIAPTPPPPPPSEASKEND